jgi:hypothetical protein
MAKGSLGGPIQFTARLSQAGPWTVSVRDAKGAVVARGSGTGINLLWTWSSTGRKGGTYTWTMEAGALTRPATGVVGKGTVPAPPPATPILAGLDVDPPVISPDGDGVGDSLTISYALAARAAVTATVTDLNGAVVATLFTQQLQGARTQSFPYAAPGLGDGLYTLTVSAEGEDGRTAQAQTTFGIDRTLSGLTLSTTTLTPNGDGSDDALGIGFSLASPVPVTVQVEQNGLAVATVFAGPMAAGVQQLTWDGAGLPDGAYVVAVIVDGPYGQTRHEGSITIAH